MKNIILCGMMGSGKSAVGKYIADKKGCVYFDIDKIITEKYGEINFIFKNYGENYFRQIENETIRQVCFKSMMTQNLVVIATGGGAVLNFENVKELKLIGKLVYLKATADTLYERLKNDTTRPLLKGDILSNINIKLNEREKVYAKTSDYTISVDEKSIEEIGDEILNKFY